MNFHQPQFSDFAIRQFLLGQLSANKRAQFERALFLDSSLEQRTRLAEIALADDYALGRLRSKDLNAFVAGFPFSAARRNQIEVSLSLRDAVQAFLHGSLRCVQTLPEEGERDERISAQNSQTYSHRDTELRRSRAKPEVIGRTVCK